MENNTASYAPAAGRRVLVVGAGGFAGGFITAEALRRGYRMTAGVRHSTSRKWLADPRISFLELDFDDPAQLGKALAGALPEGERWDYIVYNLGATKCLNFADFSRINYTYLQRFTQALAQAGKEPEKLLYISSLSAMGPGDEKGFTPFRETDIPRPDTRYGASKLKAEMWLATCPVPSIIFRCTGIYGPRDKDYFLMFKAIDRGFDFSVGFRRQMLSFIYVEDLARAVYDALERSATGQTYNIAEGRSYTQSDFRRIAAKALGRKLVIPVRMPLWAVKAVSVIAEKIGVLTLKPSTLNRDKYHIMRQRNWDADISKARSGFGFSPRVPLAEGVEKSVEWYRDNGWL